jgi:diadenosine tetraphosphatase ApaH/serine/threonine PP2A family protein phosphatase
MIAVLSDVHGNLEALEAVLRELEKEGIEEVLFLGDAVGYCANPNETVSLLKRSRVALLGNHDAAVLKLEDLENYNEFAQQALIWTSKILTEESVSWMKNLNFKEVFVEDVLLVHSSPKNPRIWRYLFSLYDVGNEFDSFSQWICLFGHTHIPCAYAKHGNNIVELKGERIELRRGITYMINPGSVGQPRDGDPRAAFGILDLDGGYFYFKRVEYDIENAQRKILENGLPPVLAERLTYGF